MRFAIKDLLWLLTLCAVLLGWFLNHEHLVCELGTATNTIDALKDQITLVEGREAWLDQYTAELKAEVNWLLKIKVEYDALTNKKQGGKVFTFQKRSEEIETELKRLRKQFPPVERVPYEDPFALPSERN